MATPQYGTVNITNGGLTRAVDIYASDVALALVRWDEGNGASATSRTNFVMPFDGWIYDITLGADIVDCDILQLCVNNTPTGDFFRNLNIQSDAERTPVKIPIRKGAELSFIQRA